MRWRLRSAAAASYRSDVGGHPRWLAAAFCSRLAGVPRETGPAAEGFDPEAGIAKLEEIVSASPLARNHSA